MDNCLHCSGPLIHVPGRKKKSFCNANCRNKYFYAERKKQIEAAKAILVQLPSDYLKLNKVSAIKSDGTVIKDVTKPTNVIKPHEQPKTNYTIDTRPKTLDQLKALCPAELTGFDRSAWIANERQKYGI